MDSLTNAVRVVHILNAILMAWPFYALVIVNQRGRLGPPLGDRADLYMENIIKNRTIPCFVFQLTALASGLALVWLRGLSLGGLIGSPVLSLKLLLLLLIIGLLLYVHLIVQPRIDGLFAQASATAIPPNIAEQIRILRLRRKRIASICFGVILTIAMLGLQVWALFAIWLTVAAVIATAVFTWRAYSSLTKWGWI